MVDTFGDMPFGPYFSGFHEGPATTAIVQACYATDGSITYYAWDMDGKLHREDGPAIIWEDGEKAWFLNGKMHRVDGPAIEGRAKAPGDGESWFLYGVDLSFDEWCELNSAISDEEKLMLKLQYGG